MHSNTTFSHITATFLNLYLHLNFFQTLILYHLPHVMPTPLSSIPSLPVPAAVESLNSPVNDYLECHNTLHNNDNNDNHTDNTPNKTTSKVRSPSKQEARDKWNGEFDEGHCGDCSTRSGDVATPENKKNRKKNKTKTKSKKNAIHFENDDKKTDISSSNQNAANNNKQKINNNNNNKPSKKIENTVSNDTCNVIINKNNNTGVGNGGEEEEEDEDWFDKFDDQGNSLAPTLFKDVSECFV